MVAGYELEKVDWSAYDLAIVCNVGRWPGDSAAGLRRFVEEGGGLLLAGGDIAGKSVPGEGWLPALPGAPRRLRPPQEVALPPGAWSHSVFSMLGTQPGLIFRRVRVRRLSPLAPVRGGRTLLTLADGTPLLVAGASGAGKVALWGATCDRDWTDIAVRPVFVPFMRALVDYLVGGIRGTSSSVVAGAPLEIRARANRVGEEVRVRPPGGREVTLRLEAVAPPTSGGSDGKEAASPAGRGRPGAALARFAGTHRAGVYDVRGPEGPEPVAANVPASEADLEPLSAEALRQRVAGLDVVVRSLAADAEAPEAAFEGRIDLGVFLLMALAAVLVFEGAVADRS
ncbi:MAG: hypothetical protein V3V62_11715 [bacterium]